MAADPHVFPDDRTSARTGISRCTGCLAKVDAETFLALDTLCEECDSKERAPSPFAGGNSSGFSPFDREDVREQIGRRGSALA